MTKPLFKAKILKPARLSPNGKELNPGEIVEVDNNTLGNLITQGVAKFHEDGTPAKTEKPKEQDSSPTVDELKAKLDELGINYRANAKKETLEGLLAQAEGKKDLLE